MMIVLSVDFPCFFLYIEEVSKDVEYTHKSICAFFFFFFWSQFDRQIPDVMSKVLYRFPPPV